MGVSTDGELHFGFCFEEGFEFPWDREDGDGDIESWWRGVGGYVNPNFYPYDEEGEYLPGVTEGDPRIGTYFAFESEWEKANPVPIAIVNYCSDSCPMYMLAVPEKGWRANRGYPRKINPSELVVTDEQRQSLIDFCAKYGIETDGEPTWYLTSYYG